MSVSEKEEQRLELLLSFSTLRQEVTGCWMVREALSFRVVFFFKDDSILTVSADGHIWLEEKTSDSKNSDNWTSGVRRGVYVPSAPVKNLTDFVINTIQERGKPKLILPWEDWDCVSDQFARSADEEQIALCRKFEEEVVNFANSEIWSECEFTYGEDCLPADCDYVDFEALVEDLAEENWIVVWDECCGPCASGSIQDAKESEPDKAASPAFVIYGQNADNYFYSDGSINDYMFSADELGKGRELQLAQIHGFKVAQHDKYEGLFRLNPS
jgi:hypothetical protein